MPFASPPSADLISVLLVEDNPDDADLVRALLLPGEPTAGFVIDVVPSMADACGALSGAAYDAVLLDLNLPDSQGARDCAPPDGARRHRADHRVDGDHDAHLGPVLLREGVQDCLTKGTFDGATGAHTIRHAIERARLQRQLVGVLEDATDGMIIVDDGEVVYANRAAQRLLSGRDDDVGRRELLALEADEGTHELTLPPTDGAAHGRTLEIRSSTFRWRGAAARLLTLRDLTGERRRRDLERQLRRTQRDAAVGRLAAAVAHEINNPTAFTTLNISMAIDSGEQLDRALRAGGHALTPEVVGHLKYIGEVLADALVGVQRIATVTRDWSSLASENVSRREQVDINEVVTFACRIALKDVSDGVDLRQELGEVPLLLAAAGRLAQVLVNLITNADHALTGADTIAPTITVRTVGSADGVKVTVEDNGPGIPEALRARVFEPFFTTNAPDVGSGLGLTLCRELVSLHGGTLEVEDVIPHGVRMVMMLPIVLASDAL